MNTCAAYGFSKQGIPGRSCHLFGAGMEQENCRRDGDASNGNIAVARAGSEAGWTCYTKDVGMRFVKAPRDTSFRECKQKTVGCWVPKSKVAPNSTRLCAAACLRDPACQSLAFYTKGRNQNKGATCLHYTAPLNPPYSFMNSAKDVVVVHYTKKSAATTTATATAAPTTTPSKTASATTAGTAAHSPAGKSPHHSACL